MLDWVEMNKQQTQEFKLHELFYSCIWNIWNKIHTGISLYKGLWTLFMNIESDKFKRTQGFWLDLWTHILVHVFTRFLRFYHHLYSLHQVEIYLQKTNVSICDHFNPQKALLKSDYAWKENTLGIQMFL